MIPASAQTLGQISESVLLTAAALAPASDSEATAGVLYHGNWLPLSPTWLARFPDEHAVTRFVASESSATRLLASRWLESRDRTWIHWNSAPAARGKCPFKVYVSVAPDDLPVAFGRCVEVLTAQAVPSFKLSRHPRGLLRPDRMVAYCSTRAQTDALVRALDTALAGLTAQGVPFTAAVGSPAVSWARDPPSDVTAYAPSWRRWVTRKLAAYLHASDAADSQARAVFACARLRQDGVDPDVWAPMPSLWERR